MASSSDWLERIELDQMSASAEPSWIAALALDTGQSPHGFRDRCPFSLNMSENTAGTACQTGEDRRDHAERLASAHPTREDKEALEAKAYQLGYDEGCRDAALKAEEEFAKERAQFRELRMAFRALDAAALDVLACELSATVMDLCRPVLGDFAADTQALRARCERAAQKLGAGPGELTLHLHPETRARLGEWDGADWTLVDDPDLAPGALRIAGPDGTVRDGPDDWARAIAQALGA